MILGVVLSVVAAAMQRHVGPVADAWAVLRETTRAHRPAGPG